MRQSPEGKYKVTVRAATTTLYDRLINNILKITTTWIGGQ